MNVLIVGAGVIGTIYGWALSEAGHTVTHFVRPGRSAKLSEGISVDIMDRRKGYKKWFNGYYRIRCAETIDTNSDYDLVIVPVKHYSIEGVLRQVVPALPHSDFLLLTQNWKGTGGIDEILPPSRYAFGDAKAGGSLHDNKLVATLYAIDIGCINGKQNNSLAKAKELFLSADIKTTVQDHILHYLWVQYAINGGMWPAVLQTGSVNATLRNRKLIQKSFSSVQECLAVLDARGVKLADFKETDIYLKASPFMRFVGISAMKIFFRFSKYIQRNTAHALSDPKEIKTCYYDLVNSGAEYRIGMPELNSFQPVIDKI
jgi:2-dehydropantoate 2-reductase